MPSNNCKELQRAKTILSILVLLVFAWLFFPFFGPMLGAVIKDIDINAHSSMNSQDETVQVCAKAKILVPAYWRYSIGDEAACDIGIWQVGFSSQSRKARVNVYPYTRYNSLESIYKRRFADPQAAKQEFIREKNRFTQKWGYEILDIHAEHLVINGAMVFITRLVSRKAGEIGEVEWEVFYYTNNSCFKLTANCRADLREQYEPEFQRIVHSLELADAPKQNP